MIRSASWDASAIAFGDPLADRPLTDRRSPTPASRQAARRAPGPRRARQHVQRRAVGPSAARRTRSGRGHGPTPARPRHRAPARTGRVRIGAASSARVPTPITVRMPARRPRAGSGDRYHAASSRCAVSTAGDPSRSAIVRATRRSRSVPRPLANSASASSVTRRAAASDSRHARRRCRPRELPVRPTTVERGPGPRRSDASARRSPSPPAPYRRRASPPAPAASTTHRSIRSRSGPETRRP